VTHSLLLVEWIRTKDFQIFRQTIDEPDAMTGGMPRQSEISADCVSATVFYKVACFRDFSAPKPLCFSQATWWANCLETAGGIYLCDSKRSGSTTD
jgi:hypothetical protein